MRNDITITYDNVQLQVRPDANHDWLLETALVAKGYGITENSLRSTKSRNEDELIEGKHWLVLQIATSGQGRNQIFWTKKGVIRLGFFIKSERAKRFRDWAEDLIVERQSPSVSTPQTLKDALLLAYQQECEIEQQKEVIATLTSKAEYADRVLNSVTGWTTTTIAKELGMTAQRLNSELYKCGVHFQNSDGVWVLYAKYDRKGFVETRTYVYTDAWGDIQTKIYTVWTERGRHMLYLLLNQETEEDLKAILKIYRAIKSL